MAFLLHLFMLNLHCFMMLPFAETQSAFVQSGANTQRVVGRSSSSSIPIDKLHCEVYRSEDCKQSGQCKFEHQVCDISAGIPHGCYALWTNDTSKGTKLLFKGCWTAVNECLKADECIAVSPHGSEKSAQNSLYFCCCTTSRCNEEFRFAPELAEEVSGRDKGVASDFASDSVDSNWFGAAVYALIPVCALSFCLFAVYWIVRRVQLKKLAHQQNSDGLLKKPLSSPSSFGSASSQLRPIELLSVKAKGRYGAVHCARWSDKLVAVKTFPSHEAESWLREQEIYAVMGMGAHLNILQYFGAEVRGSGFQMEYWLITAYHQHGSLYDYLKAHELTVSDALCISVGLLRGLSFMHEEFIASDGSRKPTVVHRDFKSRNVLLADDLRPCIADFGLSLKCESGMASTDAHGQVGTHRYMAPEVLEGATEFSPLAFRQIDVYAASLVLWEIISRTRLEDGEKVDDYRLPFEAEVGLMPLVVAVQECVVTKRIRPRIKEKWRVHPILSIFCSCLEEMWDSEPEARITAGCAYARLNGFLTSPDRDSLIAFVKASMDFEKPTLEGEDLPLMAGYCTVNDGCDRTEANSTSTTRMV